MDLLQCPDSGIPYFNVQTKSLMKMYVLMDTGSTHSLTHLHRKLASLTRGSGISQVIKTQIPGSWVGSLNNTQSDKFKFENTKPGVFLQGNL